MVGEFDLRTKLEPPFPKAQRLKKIDLDCNFQSRLKISIPLENLNPGPSEFPTKKNRGLVDGSLENFNLD